MELNAIHSAIARKENCSNINYKVKFSFIEFYARNI